MTVLSAAIDGTVYIRSIGREFRCGRAANINDGLIDISQEEVGAVFIARRLRNSLGCLTTAAAKDRTVWDAISRIKASRCGTDVTTHNGDCGLTAAEEVVSHGCRFVRVCDLSIGIKALACCPNSTISRWQLTITCRRIVI